MALSKSQVVNIALGNLGVGKEVAIITENSAEAKAASRFWDVCLDTTLRAWHWPFAKTFVDLGLVAENPTREWLYSYRYPSDCVDAQRIVSGNPRENSNTLIPYIIASDDNGLLIFSNQPEAQLQYTKRADTVGFWPHDFVMAFSAKLAMLMAPRLTSKESGYTAQMAQLFAFYVSEAKANASNEQQDTRPPEAESIRAREGECSYGPYRYEV